MKESGSSARLWPKEIGGIFLEFPQNSFFSFRIFFEFFFQVIEYFGGVRGGETAPGQAPRIRWVGNWRQDAKFRGDRVGRLRPGTAIGGKLWAFLLRLLCRANRVNIEYF